MIAILQYNAGNTRSVRNALHRLEVEPVITADPEQLRSADKVIFPGVGEASTAMTYLREKGLDKVICDLQQPFLGICLGMQLLCSHSEEGDTTTLGLFEAKVKRFRIEEKVPHMGWNNLIMKDHPLFAGLPDQPDVYFVHSYFAELAPETIATATYGHEFSAALHRNNFYGVQFHPEKSAQVGAQILQNFLDL